MPTSKNYSFLNNGGEMGALFRKKDWSKTSLGDPEFWPKSLQVMVSVMLENPFPMYIVWGDEYIQLYNDAYRPILGTLKHPQALGTSSKVTFSEIWHTIEPMFQDVINGKTFRSTDSNNMMFPLNRNGFIENCYFDFSHSPIRVEDGSIGGILVTLIETTTKKLAEDALKESNDQLQFAIEATELGTFDLNPLTNKFTANNRMKEWFGLPNDTEIEIIQAISAITIHDQPRVIEAIETALKYESGGKFNIDYTIQNLLTKKERIVRVKGRVWFNQDKVAIRFNGTLQDITKKHLAEKEKQKLIAIIEASEEYIGLTAIDSSIQFINPAGLKMLGWNGYEGRTIIDCIFPSEREFAKNNFPESLNIDNEYDEIQFWNEVTGEPFWVQWNGIKIKDQVTNQVIGIATVSPNITERKKNDEKLKTSERNLRQMIVQAPIAIAVLRAANYTVEIVNSKALELWGREENEVLNKALLNAMPELLSQGIKEMLDGVYSTGNPFSAKELPLQLLRGKALETIYIDFSYEPLYDDEGKVNGIMAIGIDVSEQVHARQIIEASEEKLNIVIEASELGIWQYNLKTNAAICSDRCVEILGYNDHRDLDHDQLLKNFHPDDLEVRKLAFEKSYITGALFYVARIIKENGIVSWAELKGKVFYDSDKNPNEILGTIRDITEERFFQQQLLEREQKFRLLADSMPQQVWTSDPAGNINYYNQSVFDFTGLSLEQILNEEGWVGIVHPDDRDRNIELWADAIKTGNNFLIEHRFRKYDGTYRWQLSRAVPQKDEDGNVQMWVGTSTDIQDQKMFTNELEELVLERTAELEQKNIDLEYMNKELQSFAYISSHDLQEPLRKIQTFASRIIDKEKDNLSDFGKDYFYKIQTSANRMQTLIQDLLAYSRTNNSDKKFEEINLATIIAETTGDLLEELQQSNGVITVGKTCDLKIIPFQFRQLLHNLISNSLKFARADLYPVITIDCTIGAGKDFENKTLVAEKQYCYIRYTDNGIGFEQQYSSKIFELFQRLGGKEKYSGTGIGLAIVKKIIENHNGTISVTSAINKGVVFSIFIPIQ
ncbi:PAS domain S-box-containing protein [Flavobacterium sp. 7E]|uniref:PAS domain-containing sensor histidine kinase n=1 Tax=Flavobacterium sp. 7E TaxID=2735898 RepID=UPI00157014CD|nr:PAS domain S-box protein [Flavobacterium sp. 7E]NRS88177.1 PAS domain S-box-containing protein [Flavobacterium sp. 7E]